MELLQTLFSNLWAVFLAVLFFGGSIFVHELGHFLAARRRGVHVERFSIGFGPRIFGWRGKDGVEYRVSWLPLGGYVALPQLADMRAIEGESSTAANLPPPSYTSKLIVFVAGAVFNVIFAFLLATILWGIGQRVSEEEQTTRVGVVLPVIELPNGQTAPGPAFTAGIKPGDEIKAVDGKPVTSMSEIGYLIALGSGRGAQGEPKVDITLVRDGQTLHVDVYPQYVGADKIRDIGLEPNLRVMIGELQSDSPAAQAGLKPGDILTHVDGQSVNYTGLIPAHFRQTAGQPAVITYLREGKSQTVTVTPRKVVDSASGATAYRIGVSLQGALVTKVVHTPPWTQIKRHVITTWRTFASLVNRHSDIGLSKMSGPLGIARGLHSLAKIDFGLVLWFTILINVNLAIFNLLPIPVLDGGHILFATIGKLRGRALPTDFIAATQSVFMVLLLSMMLYVTVFGDVRRMVRDYREERPAQPATDPAKAEKTPAATPEAPVAVPLVP